MKRLLGTLFLMVIVSGCSKQSADEYLTRAKTAIVNKDVDAAIIELKNVIRTSPDVGEARFLLGQLYLQKRQYQLAEKELNKALTLNYSIEKVLPLLSKSYHKTGADVALTKLKYKQKGLRPSQAAEITYYQLKSLINLKQTTKAQKLIAEIRGIETNSPFKALSQVLSFVNNDQVEIALQQLDVILQENKQHAETLKLKAELLLKNNQNKEALSVLRDYYALSPNDEENAFRFAHLLISQEQSKEAEPIIDKLMVQFAGNPLLNQLKSVTRFDAKDYKQALKYSEKAILQTPELTQLRLIAGYSAYYLKDYEKTNQHLSLIISELPAEHPALRLLAASQLELGLSMQASDTLTHLGDSNEEDALLFSSVGIALSKQGELVKAKKVLEQSTAISQSPEAIAQLGVLKLSLNDRTGIQNIEQALINPKITENRQYQETLATAYLSTKQFQKALNLADEWLQKNPKNLQGYLLQAAVYEKQQNLIAAKKVYQQALKIEPTNAQLKIKIIDINYLQGNIQQAQLSYQTLIDENPQLMSAWFGLYKIAIEQNKADELVKLLYDGVNKNPKNDKLVLLLAKLQIFKGDLKNASETLAPFAAQNAIPSAYWPLLAEVYIKQKHFDEASLHYKKWLVIQPHNRQAILGSLILFDMSKKNQKALKLVEEYLSRVGTDDVMQLLHSHFLIVTGNYQKAKASLDALPDNLQQSSIGQEVLGEIAIKNNNLLKALKHFLVAYKERPTARNTRFIAMSFAKTGQLNKAYQFLVEHSKKYPNDIDSMLLLANQQLPMDRNLAIASYEKILVKAPSNLVALNNLSYLYFEKGKYKIAQQKAEQALKYQANNVYVLDTLAQILMAQQSYPEALKYLEKAVVTANVDEEVYLNYIEVLLHLDKKLLAKRQIEKRQFKLASSQDKLAKLTSQYQL